MNRPQVALPFSLSRSPCGKLLLFVGGKSTKIGRLGPGLLPPALLMEEAGREGGDGGGGRHSPFRHIFSQPLILFLFLFIYLTVYTLRKTTTLEVAKCFRRDGCSGN